MLQSYKKYLNPATFFAIIFKAFQHFFRGFPKSVGRPSGNHSEAMEQMMLV
jgi:hypothetical protein